MLSCVLTAFDKRLPPALTRGALTMKPVIGPNGLSKPAHPPVCVCVVLTRSGKCQIFIDFYGSHLIVAPLKGQYAGAHDRANKISTLLFGASLAYVCAPC